MLKPLIYTPILAICFLSSSAAPTYIFKSIVRRDNSGSFNGPVTVTTTTTTQTNVGTVQQTCEITLTPITVNGVSAVREDKKCKETVKSSGAGSNGGSNNNNNGNNNNSGTSTSTSANSESSSSSSNGSVNNNNNGNSSLGSGNVVSPTDVSVIGTGTATASSSSATGNSNSGSNIAPAGVSVIGQSSTQTASGTTSSNAAVPNGVIVVGQSSVQAGATAAADQSAAAAQASSTTGFTIPGKKLQVLPIGLGVFAGISVIALIVVGLVTYERTKYRKTFRQRKLAEMAQPMGYGGMAERS